MEHISRHRKICLAGCIYINYFLGKDFFEKSEKSKSFFEENFRKLLLQFFSKDNHFESSKDENSCKYCNFLTFCNRKKKDF